jgi:hypothetical protein
MSGGWYCYAACLSAVLATFIECVRIICET